MHVFENFLGKDISSEIFKKMTATSFPWYFFEHMVTGSFEEYENTFALHTPIFRHNFIKAGNVNSKGIDLISPLLNKIQNLFNKEFVFYSVHSNLLCPNSEMNGKYCLPHIDVSYDVDTLEQGNCYTGIYYLNTCDASTRLYNEKNLNGNSIFPDFPDTFTTFSDILSEEDKFVYWEADRYHSGPATSNVPRLLLNLNFVVRKD